MTHLSRIHVIALTIAMAFAVPSRLPAEDGEPLAPKMATIVGTAVDVNGDPVPSSTVELKSSQGNDDRTLVTSENGFFEFHEVKPGVPYEITIAAENFADWTSPKVMLDPGQFKILSGIQLRIRVQVTEVQVKYDPVEIAREQLKVEETQRVLGFIPNFYVTYEKDAAPLTAKMKFQLALRVSVDPITAFGVAMVSASKQAANSPKYGQGWGAYGERFGATAADGLSDIMIGGAILPSLLHQDPRYFCQGTGSTGSRIRHAMASPFMARGDNGKWQPNYSSIGGDLASSALANVYYPQANRGARLVFGNFAIGTAERIGADLAQEFIVGRFTKRGGHMN